MKLRRNDKFANKVKKTCLVSTASHMENIYWNKCFICQSDVSSNLYFFFRYAKYTFVIEYLT